MSSDASCCPPAADAPDLRPVEGAEADEELAALAKALGHPARVQILRLLVRRNACVCGDIVDELPHAQSTVSQHLKVLKQAGLVADRAEGRNVFYSARPEGLAPLLDWMDHYGAFWRKRIHSLRTLLKEIDP